MYVSVFSELSFSTLSIGLGHGRLDVFFFFFFSFLLPPVIGHSDSRAYLDYQLQLFVQYFAVFIQFVFAA